MGVAELIEQIRSLYVTSLQQALTAHATVRAEPIADADMVDTGAASRSGSRVWQRRHDGVEANAAGEETPFAVDSEGVLGFEPISFPWGEDLNVQLAPFCWDFAEFEVPSGGLKNFVENLGDWHGRWFTPSARSNRQARERAEEGLAGVVHELSGVQENGDYCCFQVDFGSAPVLCFEDLLDVLVASGVASVTVREAV